MKPTNYRQKTTDLPENSPQRRIRELQMASNRKFKQAVQQATDEFALEHPDVDTKGLPAIDERDLRSMEAFSAATQRALMHFAVGIGNRVKDDKDLIQRIEEYFMSCVGIKNIPTIESLALSLGVSPMWIENIISGRSIGFTTDTRDILLAARTTLASIHSELALQNKVAAVPYIFYAKNFLGMVDRKEVDVNVNLGQKSAAQLIEEANALPQLGEAEPIIPEYTEHNDE